MNYEQRLMAAAKFVYTGDSASDDSPVNSIDVGVEATLKPHQIEGVSWLVRRYLLGVNVILGDEMGLGKTLQAISLLSYLKVYLKIPGPFLVQCPLSVTDGWMSEMANFGPKLRVLSYTVEKEHRCNLRRNIYERVNKEASDAKSLPFDVLLTTYDIVLLDEDFLSQVPWCYTIIDEAQRLKNPSSVLYNVLKEHFVMPRKLLMTGTPIQNNLSELWALLHFCMPSVFVTLEQFLSAFKEAGDPSFSDADKAKEQFKILKYVIGAFMLRRTKSQLIEFGTLVLPPLTEITVMAPMVALQKKVYMSILRKELTQLLALASGAHNTRSLQNIVIQLRKACSHPYLFAGIEPEPYEEGEHLVQATGKLLILDHLLQKLHACGHRVLLISQMTHTLDILQVIFYEQDWNPQVDKQALQRAHRIGQTKHVFSINLVTEQSVEEVIMRRAQRKLQLSHNIVGDDVLDQAGKEMAGAEAGDLRSVMLGLHMLDPAEVTDEESDKFDRKELIAMTETVVAFRNEERSARDGKFEVKPANISSEFNVVTKRGPQSIKIDQILDETSYLEWLVNRRSLPEEKHLKVEAAKKKAEEEKLSKWEALGYHSLSVKDPVSAPDADISSDSGAVHFVYGDCTHPSKLSLSEPTIIFSCADTSGNWGLGGMFDALGRLSTTLAVVQSYNPRCKVPRGSTSIPDLERCLLKASYSAAQKSASIHMPRISYQDGSDRSEWYTIECLLRKYAALHGINIYVYYFRRAA
ncbi:unnamed protein product [Withania somnifera]